MATSPDSLQSERGETAGVDPLQRRPVLLLDVDDVLALNTHYSGRHARQAIFRPEKAAPDLYEKLFSGQAVDALNQLLAEFNPAVVITSSWLMLFRREEFLDLFRKTGLNITEASLHEHWDAPEEYGVGRSIAIALWLSKHHRGEPVLILDDVSSGKSLVESPWDKAGHVLLCEENVGFHAGLLDAARAAIRRPFLPETHWKPWERRG